MKIVICKLTEKLENMTVVEVDAIPAVPIKKIHIPQVYPSILQRRICKTLIPEQIRFLDGSPMSLGQAQHEQIRQQWPRAIAENDHSCYDRDQDQCTQQKSVGQAKARFTGIADIINIEFQGHYTSLDTDQWINSANDQQVKGEAIVQSITPLHMMPTPQA